MTVTAEDLELFHFGVKGMKWGKRKQKDSNESTTTSFEKPNPDTQKKYFGLTKKQAAIGATVIVGVALSAVLIANSGSIKSSVLETGFKKSTLISGKTRVDALLSKHGDSKDLTLPKGQVFTRVSKIAENSLRQGTYATYKPKDVSHYEAFWGSAKNRHTIKIEALADIVTPSLKERINTMAEMIDTPLPNVYSNGKSIRSNLVSQQTSLRAKLWVKTAKAEELAKYKYSSITGDNWSKGIGKEFADRLIAKGYGAMLDDEDSGSLADSPMVLLNQGLFRINSTKKMSKSDVDKAYSDFNKMLAN